LELFLEQTNGVRSEQELVTRAQSGDTAAFEQLYRQNVGRVFAVCLRMVKEEERAEELTQEIFIRAWEMLGKFRGESLFSTWLHRIAVNMTLESLRSEKRYAARVESTDDVTMFDNSDDLVPPETLLDLEDAIKQLPANARAVFVLHDIEGYKHEEIGEQLGVATGTSKAQLHRARKLLREMIER
jgi:RNA polymerase sigma-70 factor (ECF subfamily)